MGRISRLPKDNSKGVILRAGRGRGGGETSEREEPERGGGHNLIKSKAPPLGQKRTEKRRHQRTEKNHVEEPLFEKDRRKGRKNENLLQFGSWKEGEGRG